MTDPRDRLKQITDREKEKHRADVVWIQKNQPELAEFLTEMVKCFGRCDYRVVIYGFRRVTKR